MSGRAQARSVMGIVGGILVIVTMGCGPGQEKGMKSVQTMTDALHAVISSNRETYQRAVVDRLQYQERVLTATEHFNDEKQLPLPAQMLRMGATEVAAGGASFNYSLISSWAINKQNGPRTETEKAGLRAVSETGKNYYTEEILGGKKYFAAYYPDKAVTEGCVTCHNAHKDSPRKDFRIGDVLGGVVIRVEIQ
jgi:hypothetical protein